MTDLSIGRPASPEIAKAQAKRLKNALAPEYEVGHGQALELIARVHGETDWGRLNSLIKTAESVFAPIDESEFPHENNTTSMRSPPSGTEVEQRVLQALCHGLECATETTVVSKTLSKTKKLLNDEIIPSIALEEWLDTLDVNLGGMVFDMGSENLLRIAGVKTVSRFHRPKVSETSVNGFQGLRPAAFSAVLIWLERIGFDTHPEAFYAPLLDDIKQKKFIDTEELACLWHAKEKGRFQTYECFVDTKTINSNVEREDIKGRNGLKVRIARSTDQLRLIESLQIYR